MRSKKNYSVRELIEAVNHQNKTGSGSAECRAGANSLLDKVLHETGNYEGFRFLLPDQVPEGQKPGCTEFRQDMRNEYPDETRRAYHVSKEL